MAWHRLAGLAFPVLLTLAVLLTGAFCRSHDDVTSVTSHSLRSWSRRLLSEDDEPELPPNDEQPYADSPRSLAFISDSDAFPSRMGSDPLASHGSLGISFHSNNNTHRSKFGIWAKLVSIFGLGSMIVMLCCHCGILLWQCAQPVIYYFSVIKERSWGRLARSIEPGRERDDFDTQKCSCLDDLDYLCVGVCFFGCRLADNVAVLGNNEGVMNYWAALGIYILTGVVSTVLVAAGGVGLLLFWAAQTVVMVYLRSKLRRAIGRRADMDVEDFAFWCCCPCLALVQEAKEVDKASGTKMGRMLCCCPRLIQVPLAADTIVGSPVAAAGASPVASSPLVPRPGQEPAANTTAQLQQNPPRVQATAPPV